MRLDFPLHKFATSLLLMGIAASCFAQTSPEKLETSPVPAGWRLVNAGEGSIAPTEAAFGSKQLLVDRKIRLIGIRHGQSMTNAEAEAQGARILCGQVETPLSPLGRQQAKQAAQLVFQSLGGDSWAVRARQDKSLLPVIYASPLERAQETARATCDLLEERLDGPKLEILIDPRLTEYGFGEFELASVTDACRRLPEFMHNWDPSEGLGIDFLHRFPGGESRADALVRVHSFLQDLAERHSNRTVLLFCHMRTLAAAQEDLGQMPVVNGRVRETTSQLKNATPIELIP